jgi:prolyl 4-hydroxylase
MIVVMLILTLVMYWPRQIKYGPPYVSVPDYKIRVYDDVMTPEECAALRTLAEPKLTKSAVYSSDTDVVDANYRISDQCWLQEKDTDLVQEFRKRIRKLVKYSSKAHLEDVQVVRYQPGGFFSPHYDACVGTKEFCHRMNQPYGPRYITVLLYLSDELTGGETVFPRLGTSVTPKVGRVVVFYNITKQHSVIEEALHGGQPVKTGEKWIANQWIRIW